MGGSPRVVWFNLCEKESGVYHDVQKGTGHGAQR